MKLKFNARRVYRENQIYPLCENAKRLLRLMNRGYLKPSELSEVGALGFEIDMVGEVKHLNNEINKLEQHD